MRRTELELSVERDLPGADGVPPARARLSAKFAVADDGTPPSAAELSEALAGLRRDLDLAAGPSAGTETAPRRERALAELIETYRPRQAELVELLFEEGELSATEHRLLAEHLARSGASPAAPVVRAPPAISAPAPRAEAPREVPSPSPSAPLAAAPVSKEGTSGRERPVPELLATFQITSLKQAGAVRARRQISFEEYMALKRHFSVAEGGAAEPPPAPSA